MNYKIKKVSISIVIYKNYSEVLKAIDSIKKYTSDSINLRIFLIDNSATESQDKKNFLKKIEKYSDVLYFSMQKNVGFGRAHNSILPSLNSDLHIIMNPDIVFCEDTILKIIEFMDKNLDIGMVIPKLVDQSNQLEDVYRRNPTVFDMFIRFFHLKFFKKRLEYHNMHDEDFSKPFRVPFGQGSFLAIRTNVFTRIHGFDERYFMYMEDADLCRRVNEISKLMYFPGTSVYHKWEKGSHKNFHLFRIHVKSMAKYFIKWGI